MLTETELCAAELPNTTDPADPFYCTNDGTWRNDDGTWYCGTHDRAWYDQTCVMS
jgi:hypothetical protein